VASLLGRIRGAYPALNTAAAAVLIGFGALTLTGRLTALNSLVPDVAPPAQTAYLSAPAAGPAGVSRLSGRPLPAVTVTDTAGRRLAVAALRGRPLVINFFATWCVPCRQELPLFAAAAQAHRDQGLAVVPIDYEESAGAVEAFWRQLGVDLTPYLDPGGAAAHAFGVGLDQTGLPVTVLADRHGIARDVLPGQVDPDLFAIRLQQVLEE
jgi:cytochrome c biogenesis protein CcmG/thiol:disulfide interchange protein DsbE